MMNADDCLVIQPQMSGD